MMRILTCATMMALALPVFGQLNLAEVSAEIAARAEPVTLTFWQTHNAEETETLRAMVEDFQRACPNIRIDMAYEPFDGARDKFIVTAGGGGGPDILRAEIMWVAEFAELGLLREVTYFLTEEDRADFLPTTLVPVDYDGDLWGLPQVTDCLALLHNRAMFESAGLAPPRTWEELVAQQSSWEAAHPGIREFAFALSDSYFFLPFLWSFGGDMVDTATREPLIASEQGVAALDFVLRLRAQGVLPPDFDVANDYNNRMEQFKNGRVGSILNGPWATADILQGEAFRDPSNLGVAPVPHTAGGDVHVSPVGGHALVITARCQEPEAAYLFIHWLTAPEQQARFATANNLLPTRRSAYELPAVRQNRIVQAFGRLLAETARNRPVLPRAGQLLVSLNGGFHAALRGELAPQQALQRVATDWRALLGP